MGLAHPTGIEISLLEGCGKGPFGGYRPTSSHMTDQLGGTLSAAKVIISEYFTCKSLQFKILRRSPPSMRKIKSLRMSILGIHTKGDCEELEDKYLFHNILVVSLCGLQYFARPP
jgi:hypothetical protein